MYVFINKTKNNPQNINTYINKIHNNLKLTPTHKEQNSINYLDLTIRHQHNKFNIDIYRKPTATDTTINFLNHLTEQKMAAFRSHLNRMHSLPLSQDKKKKNRKNGKPYKS